MSDTDNAQAGEAVSVALPSPADITKGAAPAVWGPDPSAIPPEARERPDDPIGRGISRSVAELGIPAEIAEGARRWFTGEVQFSPQQLEEFDAQHRAQTETTLRSLWGDDYEANVGTVRRYLKTLPAGAGDVFLNGRDGNGRALANDPASLQRVLGAAKARGSFDLPQGDARSQIAAIERHMRSNREAYNKDELLQETYRQLLVARENGQ